MVKLKVGDRVKTPDGRIITIQGILDVHTKIYHASLCHPLTEAEAHAAEQTLDTSKQAAGGGPVPGAIIWGT